jgi:hypothetical protein
VITSVVEQFWLFDVTYSIEAFKGTGTEAGSTLELLSRTARSTIMTSGHALRAGAVAVAPMSLPFPCSKAPKVDRHAPPGPPPRPLKRIVPDVTVNITWLVQQLSDQM